MSGYVFTLGGGVISWRSCKQTILTRSTMEAELNTFDTATVEAEWLRFYPWRWCNIIEGDGFETRIVAIVATQPI